MIARRWIVLAALASALAAGPAAAQQPADSTKDHPGTPFFRPRDAVLAGAFAVGTVGFAQLDRRLAHSLQDPGLQESAVLEHGSSFFNWMGDPGAPIIAVGIYGIGMVARNRPIAALGLHGVEAGLLAGAISGVIKGLAGRARPYVNVDTVPNDFAFGRGIRGGTKYASFPSGHTTNAFTAAAVGTAEIVHWTEVKGWWPGWPYVTGATLFTGATMVGLARMYKDQHWASDVVAGAAIGTFSGLKVVKYAYRHPQNRLDRWLLPKSVVPDGRGAMVVWTIPTGGAAAR